MIVQFFLDLSLGAMKLILVVIPTLPAMPSEIIAAGTWVTTQITNSMAILNMIYGQTLLAAMMVVIIGMFNFEWIYRTIMWGVHKIPIWDIT